ncbi:tripartite tricarboxylate transporter permease [uncultured Sphaerochaeta sp.]|uniref:tripartite tricarboxylate transporter permease n=1 Tax=uncultured Sphaerochaeta sp. TaxID=886478 RepID=UPI002A0A34AE|nr:tripartite tricarboxylate transporter permease [uncultured Sphaerochaeta sp.]
MLTYLPYILSQFGNPYNLVLLVMGNVIGIIFGAIPGLSGTLAVVLFMPLTFSMATGPAIILLISLWVGGCSGAFIGSILLGIPGSPSSVATCFDGYPMAQNGKAGKALAIGMTASFFGTFFSAILGALLSKTIADLAFKLGPWEYFSLCLFAITMVVAISKGNMFKGLASGCVGLLFASVGFSPIDAESRFVFGNMYLMSGLSMIVVLIGIFGVSKIIVEYAKGFATLPEVDTKSIKGIGITFKEIKLQMKNILRSFGIGLGIGFLPGMGAGLSNLVAYSACKNGSKTPELFGKGNPEGVWASEISNNAAIGGSLIPMAALGIPGDSTTALLIGALTVHGLEMGPMVFKNSGDVVYLMFAAVAACAIVVFILQALGMRLFPQILKVPYHYMYPVLLVISFVSCYVDSGSLYKCGMLIVFAIIGIVMEFAEMPVAPLILAFILGPTLELNMLKAFQYTGTATTFFTRPISCVLLLITLGSLFMPLFKKGLQTIQERKLGK